MSVAQGQVRLHNLWGTYIAVLFRVLRTNAHSPYNTHEHSQSSEHSQLARTCMLLWRITALRAGIAGMRLVAGGGMAHICAHGLSSEMVGVRERGRWSIHLELRAMSKGHDVMVPKIELVRNKVYFGNIPRTRMIVLLTGLTNGEERCLEYIGEIWSPASGVGDKRWQRVNYVISQEEGSFNTLDGIITKQQNQAEGLGESESREESEQTRGAFRENQIDHPQYVADSFEGKRMDRVDARAILS
jgi:hypothetical protein